MEKEKLRLLVKVCQLYFHEGLNQQDIAKKYGISRPQVSRLISQAKAEGIVEITIRNPFSDESEIERELVELFGLRDVIVVDTADADTGLADVLIAQAAAAHLESIFIDGELVGVMAGKTVNVLAKELKDPQKKNLTFIPLIGGWGAEVSESHANMNCSIMAKQAKGANLILNAPAIVSSEETKKRFLKEPDIEKVITMSKEANLAIIGIGQVSESATFYKSTNLDSRDLTELIDVGAVCSIGTSFINKEGEEVGNQISDRMIGITGIELKRVGQVIALARGLSKADAIHAALTGGWVDVLITDMKTAKAIVEKGQRH
ncbi:sugar-binding transcriptional regulator [Neobacillus notoginsengisoli]|uniref:Sugar-binding transcriptional regulator n=1 Tax=Neobacillus notoginsengisoli TaxID=1578198 RepID=A0A417YYG6_9BACI|nr:sugar-binding transcriptional regulator [Neobacillus notoginsengisoli]RHW42754.1 sugar-binding transcriptional regulator [Neobacillus notoginsengisoli]